jgi:hypothetical protein
MNGGTFAQDRERIAREPAYHYVLRKEFEEHGCKIRALNDRGDDSPEGELTDGILDQLAKFERAKTAERSRRTSYTAIADEVVGIMRSDALNSDEYDPARHRMCKPKVELLVDKTGYLAGILEGEEDADEDEADLLEGDEEVED